VEASAQQFLRTINDLYREGGPFRADLRLRPDGGKGLLVRSYEALRNYEADGMELWERFALGQARLIQGSPEALPLVRACANALSLTSERLRELTKMKRRIETERILPQHVRRQVKLGAGGLNDIEWAVRLAEMRELDAAPENAGLEARIHNLGRLERLSAHEVDVFLRGRRHLLEVRTRLWLLGQEDDLIPENPDKLDRVGQSFGLADGNTFLRRHH
jgi:glutamate-ammonia-ligase adenylyltransferase